MWRKPLLTKLSEILDKDSVYYTKIAAIYSLKAIALAGNDVELTQIISSISKSLSNTVPNVRLIAAKSLRQIAKKTTIGSITEDCQKAVYSLS